jgi:hypothetical protein
MTSGLGASRSGFKSKMIIDSKFGERTTPGRRLFNRASFCLLRVQTSRA